MFYLLLDLLFLINKPLILLNIERSKEPENLWTIFIFFAASYIRLVKLFVSK